MTNSKERFNDGKVKVTAKRKIKANFGMVDTNMQKIGTYGYEGFVQANEDPY